MHTENQLPRLPGSALKVHVWGGGVGSYPLLSLAPTRVEVELGCDNMHKCSINNPHSESKNRKRNISSGFTFLNVAILRL